MAPSSIIFEILPDGTIVQEYNIIGDTFTFGRASSCDVHVEGGSGVIAQLTVGDSGLAYLTIVEESGSVTQCFSAGAVFKVAGRSFKYHSLATPKVKSVIEIPASASPVFQTDQIATHVATLQSALARSQRAVSTCHSALRSALDSQRRMQDDFDRRVKQLKKSRQRESDCLRVRIRELTALADRSAEVDSLKAEHAALLAEMAAMREQYEAAPVWQAEKAELVKALDETRRRLRERDDETEHLRARTRQLELELHTERESSRDIRAYADDFHTRTTASTASVRAVGVAYKQLRTSMTKIRTGVQQHFVMFQRDIQRTAESVLNALQLSEKRTKVMMGKLAAAEDVRRALHEQIMELKGNIRVFCRVRPYLRHEQPDEQQNLLFPGDGVSLTLTPPPTASATDHGGDMKPKKQEFAFDKVFEPDTHQEDLFKEVAQLVQSSLDGFRVCIFAYGQTGSGKTHTMEGGRGEQAGVIPRAIKHMFDRAAAIRSEHGWVYTFSVSILEIYNDSLRDLLRATPTDRALNIKHDADGNTYIPDLTIVPVTEPSQVESLLKQAAQIRAVGATNSNEHSSRSHLAFQLRMNGTHPEKGRTVSGMLTLVDLAGSERLRVSGSTGDRLREAQHINKSLSALGDVICALAAKEAHVPYRNSKLTYLLADSLGGSNKTLMIVTMSPTAASLPESICSLRFAQKVSSVIRGQAKKHAQAALK